jgi:hypothetical protein
MFTEYIPHKSIAENGNSLNEQLAKLFSRSNNSSKENGQITDDSHRAIKQLTVECDFLCPVNKI